MGNCMTNNRVVSREADKDDDNDCRLPFEEEKKGGGRDQGGTVHEEKKRKTEKKVRFKLEDDYSEGYGGEKCRDLGKEKRGTRRIKLVVTKEEWRQILEYAEGSSRHDSPYSLEERLMMTLSSSRSGGRVYSNEGGDYWSPLLDRIPEHH